MEKTIHTFLFTGHMIDWPGRETPRFPESKEEIVREWIMEAVRDRQRSLGGNVSLRGISGGACGGDILFHEVCEELWIPTTMYLALPKDAFIGTSVSPAGVSWVKRFERLFSRLPHPVLSEQKGLPAMLHEGSGVDLWTRNNLWELHGALEHGGENMTLFALWDQQGGDGPGGTADMVKVAGENGASVVVIDMMG